MLKFPEAFKQKSTRAGQHPTAGGRSDDYGLHFMARPRTTLNPQDYVTKVPAHRGGRVLPGGPFRPLIPGEGFRSDLKRNPLYIALLSLFLATPTLAEPVGLGREALPEEIAAWDIDVMPDGTGLPVGSGDVMTGEELFLENCASCHGDFAEGLGNWPALAGGEETLNREDPVKTVGSYWPHLSTVWDYVHRSMPFGQAQILSADETYAITAYILYSNYLVEEDFTLSNENFGEITLPNAEGFIEDDRPETEYPVFSAEEPCMENCKDSVEITMHASVLDVTPNDAEDDAKEAEAVPEESAAEATVEAAEPEQVAAPEEAEPEAQAAPQPDPELAAAGEKLFAKCKACHMVGEGAKNRTGPMLNGVMGRQAGMVEGFKYSPAMTEAGENGLVWTTEEMAQFLADPKGFVPKTKMAFAGMKKQEELDAIAAYLATFSE